LARNQIGPRPSPGRPRNVVRPLWRRMRHPRARCNELLSRVELARFVTQERPDQNVRINRAHAWIVRLPQCHVTSVMKRCQATAPQSPPPVCAPARVMYVQSDSALSQDCDLAWFLDPLRRIQHFDRNNVPGSVVVKDYAWLILVAFRNGDIAEHDCQRIGLGVVVDFRVLLQYLSILLVRYAVKEESLRPYST